MDKLIEVYIENYGVSAGMRTAADYAADYWIKEWKHLCPDVPDDVVVLYDVMPLHSEYYRANREEIDEYDITIMSKEDLREVCLQMVHEIDDLHTQIALYSALQIDLKISESGKEKEVTNCCNLLIFCVGVEGFNPPPRPSACKAEFGYF